MKKILADMAIKWHKQGCTVREIAKLMPQCNIDEIRVIISNNDRKEGKG